MVEIKQKLIIEAPPDVVWEHLIDVKEWWLDSNPDHIDLEIKSADQKIRAGTRMLIRERIAGILGEALGEISEFVEGEKVIWESNKATYQYLGIRFSVREGVSWQIEPVDKGSELTAHVWAHFPKGFFGRILEWWFKHIIDGVSKDREHAMTELRFLKTRIERMTPNI